MKKNRLIFIILFICLILLSLATIGIGMSKYVVNDDINTQISVDEFIFISNYQDKNTYELYRDNVTIKVSNTDLSGTNKTDIKFNVTLSNNLNSETVVYNDNILTGNSVNDSKSFTFTDLVIGTIYTVTISSTSPVKKIITHTFIVKKDPTTNNYYSLTNFDGWIELDIYVGSNDIDSLIIEYPTTLSADNTNDLTKDWYGQSGTLTNLSNNSHYHLIFFKNDSSSYDNVVQKEIGSTNVIIISND